MKLLRTIIYILLIPIFLYLVLFFEYLSFFNLFLVFSVFIFKDLKKLNLLWFLIPISILLDVSMHLWLGTHVLSIFLVLLLLLLFNKFVGNFFLDIVFVFFAFLFFRFFFQTYIFFQDTSSLLPIDMALFNDIVLFAVKNIFLYLILKTAEYFLKSYFREDIL